MKGFGKQIVAGLIVALFITTATYFVIYTAGFAYNDQAELIATNINEGDPGPTTTYIPTPFPTPTPTPTSTPVPPVRIGTTPYQDLQTAYNDATDTSVIEMLAGTLPGSLDAYKPIDITIKGGFDTTYTTNSGITVIQGEFTLSYGSIIVERIGIE